MLSEREKDHLVRALSALRAEDGSPWHALEPLARLAEDGTRLRIDFTTEARLGAPVIIAERGPQPLPSDLTPRQRDVCALLAEGLPNKMIAARLGISTATAKDHVHAILRKFGVSRRSEVIARLHWDKA